MTVMPSGVSNDERVDALELERAASSERTLVDSLLAEQRSLTAIERFSQKHSDVLEPLQARYYKDLIPIRKPSTGEQYAFEVDMDKCTGCKACVVACHSLNGLKESESWRDIGTIRGISDGEAQQQTVTSACHHCLDPACLSGCPVGAYEKLEDSGVVKHLDDQCIGCQYCSLKCPYDVPKYDSSLGIVRKCDMCHERLAEGEAPACVQSCPNGAISIQLVDVEQSRATSMQGGSMVAGAFRSDYTLPTTTFRSSRKLDDSMVAADENDLTPSHNHVPLVWMLVLTQVAVGASVLDLVVQNLGLYESPFTSLMVVTFAVVLGKVGLVSSLLHLGSPLGAWRVFLGLKTSWLSREIVAFGGWMPALLGYAALKWYPMLSEFLPEPLVFDVPAWLVNATGAAAAVLGLLSVFCSVMVYVDTKRAFWGFWKTTGRFLGSAMVGSFAVLSLAEFLSNGAVSSVSAIGVVVGVMLKAFVEACLLLPARQDSWSYAKKSAMIQLYSLKNDLGQRWGAFSVALAAAVLATVVPGFALLIFPAIFMGELLERSIFFQAVVTLKMPGEIIKN